MKYRRTMEPFIKCFICVLIIAVTNLSCLISRNTSDMPIAEEILYLFCEGTYQQEYINITQTIIHIVPLWIWVLLFSNCIVDSKDLDNLYVFIRYNRRKVWYKNKLRNAIYISVFFSVLHSLTYSTIATYVSVPTWTIADIKILSSISMIVWLYCWIHVLIANCFRMVVAEERVSVYVIFCFIAELAGCSVIDFFQNKTIGVINPTYFMMNFYKLQKLEMAIGMGYLIVLAVLVVWIGLLFVKQVDIGICRKR